MLEYLLIPAAVFVFLLLTFLGWVWGGYNVFVRGKQNIKTILGDIKAEYQRRADLFYNLVEATKSYAKFEKDTLTQVIAARNSNFGKTPKENLAKMKQLDGLFSKLMVVVERYPNLRATEEYKTLMEETKTTENRIEIARTEYNNVVRQYNLSVMSFPSNILAGMFHFLEEEYFENEQGTNSSPKMNLRID